MSQAPEYCNMTQPPAIMTQAPLGTLMDARLIDARALSMILDISPRTLETIVARGEGPPFIRLGRQRRWRLEDVDAWIKAKQALMATQS